MAHDLPNYGAGVGSAKIMRVVERSKVSNDQRFNAGQHRETCLCRFHHKFLALSGPCDLLHAEVYRVRKRDSAGTKWQADCDAGL